jgi:hypothetical protein
MLIFLSFFMHNSIAINTVKIAIALLVNALSAQHYRGMCILNDSVVWLSGSKGFVVRTNNGGLSWDTLNPAGYGKKDFRDIHAWSTKEAIVISSGDSAVMLRTSNGGKSWKRVMADNSAGVFWDAMDVQMDKIILVGDGFRDDPMDMRIGKFAKRPTPLYTQVRYERTGISLTFRSFYAASGSNIQWVSPGTFAIIPVFRDKSYYELLTTSSTRSQVSKHKKQRFYSSLLVSEMPFKTQKGGGAYSFEMRNGKEGAAVGGSYLLPDGQDSVACYTTDSGKTWQLAAQMPGGYRSCVAFCQGNSQGICTGTNGSDITTDGGIHWNKTSLTGYNVCGFGNQYLWLAGSNGKWERVSVDSLFYPNK